MNLHTDDARLCPSAPGIFELRWDAEGESVQEEGYFQVNPKDNDLVVFDLDLMLLDPCTLDVVHRFGCFGDTLAYCILETRGGF